MARERTGRRTTGMRLDEIIGKPACDELAAELYQPPHLRPKSYDAKIAAVVSAFTDPGPCPRVHWAAHERLKQEWPTLYNALKELCG